MLYYNTIEPKTLELLKNIQKIPIFNNLYLVGGTSLALQIGHRISVDLDFFGKLDVDRHEIIKILENFGKVKTINYTKNINVFTIDNIKVDIVNYAYPWLKPNLLIDNLKLADPKDIAAMKIAAITGRGSKKDFIDLFFLLRIFSLKQILSFYEQKYSDASTFLALRSLTYFDDADLDPMPKMLEKNNWKKIKSHIIEEVKKISL